MQRMKNKRRLTIAAIVCLLTFVVGAVFAATEGVLDIGGMVGFGAPEVRVEWTNAVVGPVVSGELPSHLSFNTARILDSSIGIANHRIAWLVTFIGEGEARLTGTVTNSGQIPAYITNVRTDFTEFGLGSLDDWGLEYGTSDMDAFTATALSAGASRSVTIILEWDGTFPASTAVAPLNIGAGFDHADFADFDVNTVEFVFEIIFEYSIDPPPSPGTGN